MENFVTIIIDVSPLKHKLLKTSTCVYKCWRAPTPEGTLWQKNSYGVGKTRSQRPSVRPSPSLSFIFSASTSLQPRVNKKESLFFSFFFFLICPLSLSTGFAKRQKDPSTGEIWGSCRRACCSIISPLFSPSIAALSVSTRGWKSPPNELYNYYTTLNI